MKPTIGRVVHYRPVTPLSPEDVRAAIITRVWSETCVNLEVFGDSLPEGRQPTSVTFSATEARAWFWPPRE